MKNYVLFIHGAGEGAYEEDGLLVASLQNALGPAYDVHYPKMPAEDSATYEDWKTPIDTELATRDGEIILVGHSVGGSVLLKYLSEVRVGKPIAGLFLIAAPFWGADEFWTWDEVRLPQDVAKMLANIPRIFLYHSQDDHAHADPLELLIGGGIRVIVREGAVQRVELDLAVGRQGDADGGWSLSHGGLTS